NDARTELTTARRRSGVRHAPVCDRDDATWSMTHPRRSSVSAVIMNRCTRREPGTISSGTGLPYRCSFGLRHEVGQTSTAARTRRTFQQTTLTQVVAKSKQKEVRGQRSEVSVS